MRFIPQYILASQRHTDAPRLSQEARTAIAKVSEMANDADFNVYMDLQPGEMQFINNYHVLHGRTAYEDDVAHGYKRHLKRLWLATYALTDRPAHFAALGRTPLGGQALGEHAARRGAHPPPAPEHRPAEGSASDGSASGGRLAASRWRSGPEFEQTPERELLRGPGRPPPRQRDAEQQGVRQIAAAGRLGPLGRGARGRLRLRAERALLSARSHPRAGGRSGHSRAQAGRHAPVGQPDPHRVRRSRRRAAAGRIPQHRPRVDHVDHVHDSRCAERALRDAAGARARRADALRRARPGARRQGGDVAGPAQPSGAAAGRWVQPEPADRHADCSRRASPSTNSRRSTGRAPSRSATSTGAWRPPPDRGDGAELDRCAPQELGFGYTRRGHRFDR